MTLKSQMASLNDFLGIEIVTSIDEIHGAEAKRERREESSAFSVCLPDTDGSVIVLILR